MQTVVDPLAVDLKEAGRLLGLSPHTLRKRVRNGTLRHSRIGRRVLVKIETLRELLNRNERKPVAK